MSTALYRRYRPETFAEVIGQEHVTEPLITALTNNRVNHAYLFSGPRGCGKTTSARILARCLNCIQGPTPTPCGVCDSCRELSRDGGGSLDVIEMDAASHGGVDHARDLRERATLAPVRDRYKIFIIDEAHMVTREGFNALLKIVEEPPEHIKFIFATTEPNKVLGTIRSRTHHYPFRLVPPEVLLPYLEKLCGEENVPVESGVLQLVIRAGGGSVRDSLSILDQLIAGANTESGISYDRAVALLGYTHAQLLDNVIDAFSTQDAPSLFEAVSRVVATGQDPRRFVEDLLERLRDLIVVQTVPQNAAQILQGVPADQIERLKTQAQAFATAQLTGAASTVNEVLNSMTGATNPQLQLELLCARLLVPAGSSDGTGGDLTALTSRLDALERRLAAGGAGAHQRGGRLRNPAAGQGVPSAVQNSVSPSAGGSAERQPPAQHAAPPLAAGGGASKKAAGAEATNASAQHRGPVLGQNTNQQVPKPKAEGEEKETPQNQQSQGSAPQNSAPLASAAEGTGSSEGVPSEPTPSRSAPSEPSTAQETPVKRVTVADAEDPLASVRANWRAVIARVSAPGASEKLLQVEPVRLISGELYVRADMPTLKAVASFVPELSARVSDFLRKQVRVRAEVARPQTQPDARPTQAPAANQKSSDPAPIADGPRGGVDAWNRHGQPVPSGQEAASQGTTNVDVPITAWEVAPIPQDSEDSPADLHPNDTAEGRPAAASQSGSSPQDTEPQDSPSQPGTSSEAQANLPPETEPVPPEIPEDSGNTRVPEGGFGERDSFAASGSGIPQQDSPSSHEQGGDNGNKDPQNVDNHDEPVDDSAQDPGETQGEGSSPSVSLESVDTAENAEFSNIPAPSASAPLAAENKSAREAAASAPVSPLPPLAQRPDSADTKPEEPPAESEQETAPARGQRAQQEQSDEEDVVSDDDERIENSVHIGLRAIEKVIGGKVIDERPLHQI
ncbi:DNA polymerase III subunit gamma and tau [Rothia dentocariosa]|uniref:DNA polymerase III subunit gamma and tau n=1 Tax=Rothia dentocariosa TaxID=2047 RepID=UPI003A844A5D